MKKLIFLAFFAFLFITNISAQSEDELEMILVRVMSGGARMTPDELKAVEKYWEAEKKNASAEEVTLMEAILKEQRLSPEDANKKDQERNNAKLAEYKKEFPEKFEKVKDQGPTNDLHKKNVGKIVFATSEIAKSESSGSNFKTSFSSLAGGIYARIYLGQSVENHLADVGEAGRGKALYYVEYYLDGKLMYTANNNELDEESKKTWTTWQVPPAPTAADDYNYGYMPMGFAEAIKETKPGKYKVKMVAAMQYLDYMNANIKHTVTLASGEFEVIFTQSERDAFVKKNGFSAHYKPAENSLSGGGNRVSIYVENKTGSTIKYSISGDGMSGEGSIYNNDKSHITAPIGYYVKINGKDYYKTTKDDNNKTITVK